MSELDSAIEEIKENPPLDDQSTVTKEQKSSSGFKQKFKNFFKRSSKKQPRDKFTNDSQQTQQIEAMKEEIETLHQKDQKKD